MLTNRIHPITMSRMQQDAIRVDRAQARTYTCLPPGVHLSGRPLRPGHILLDVALMFLQRLGKHVAAVATRHEVEVVRLRRL